MPIEQVTIVPGHELGYEQGDSAVQLKHAVDEPDLWAGLSASDPGVASEWHHHGSNTTVFYMLAGEMTVEFGAAGKSGLAKRGDFVVIPAGVVHREITQGKRQVNAVVVRYGDGEGPDTVEVEGPEG